MISARHTTNRQSFKKVTCPFKGVRQGVAVTELHLHLKNQQILNQKHLYLIILGVT